MELYFLRHGQAVEKDAGGFRNDAERPLALQGLKQMERTGEGMRRLGFSFDKVFSSPYLRARQTAQAVVKGLKENVKIEPSECLVPDADFKDFCGFLKKTRVGKRVLLVGHEPSLGTFVSRLISGGDHAKIDIRKGSLCRVDVFEEENACRGELKWLLIPEIFR
ncbi:MAG: phosphohistidine phosphatase SixA [Candidatus Omnitrophica bacterium]|nr:phosphohistidine phosphatase SixA [Candidatus Omnitrophota bacterium]